MMSEQHIVSTLKLILPLIELLSQKILLQVMILYQPPPPELSHFIIKPIFLSPHQPLGLLGIHLLEVLLVLEQG